MVSNSDRWECMVEERRRTKKRFGHRPVLFPVVRAYSPPNRRTSPTLLAPLNPTRQTRPKRQDSATFWGGTALNMKCCTTFPAKFETIHENATN